MSSLVQNPFKQSLCEILTPGQLGNVKLEHVEISGEMSLWTAVRAAVKSSSDPYVPPGRYCHLIVGQRLMMSDTPMEKRSNRQVVHQAHGDVLIAGLGIGMILLPILSKPEVKSVTVVEKYEGVVNLVAPAILAQPGGEKLTVVHGDIHEWRPTAGTKFDTLYFDIWPAINEDNLKEMSELHSAFRKHRRVGGWMDSWMRAELKRRQQRRRRQEGF